MAVALGIIVGLVLGLTGAGGSILAVPLLMWGLGWSLPQAAPVALIGVCAAAGLGTILAWDVAHVRYRAAALMALASVFTAPLGIWSAQRLRLDVLTGLFAAVLVLAALRIWRQTRASAVDLSDEHRPLWRLFYLDPATGRIVWTFPAGAGIAGVGGIAGFLAGLLGVGGGFVIVPSLRSLSELSIHSAVGTSLMAIALISATTVGMTTVSAGGLPWRIALPFVAGAIAGMLAARRLAPRIAGARLQQGLAGLMLTVAAGMAAHALHLA
jgi:hypothetical protein